MNLIEAIKSGRRFKRKVWPHYPAENTFCQNDIIADDWEVESQPVTITREQFDAAWRRALDVSENMQITTQHYLYELVVRELGL